MNPFTIEFDPKDLIRKLKARGYTEAAEFTAVYCIGQLANDLKHTGRELDLSAWEEIRNLCDLGLEG